MRVYTDEKKNYFIYFFRSLVLILNAQAVQYLLLMSLRKQNENEDKMLRFVFLFLFSSI
jgi:hypothetical protein